ncbi:hypothetical protein V6N13_116226 [Hibiscus sabdariffa]
MLSKVRGKDSTESSAENLAVEKLGEGEQPLRADVESSKEEGRLNSNVVLLAGERRECALKKILIFNEMMSFVERRIAIVIPFESLFWS